MSTPSAARLFSLGNAALKEGNSEAFLAVIGKVDADTQSSFVRRAFSALLLRPGTPAANDTATGRALIQALFSHAPPTRGLWYAPGRGDNPWDDLTQWMRMPADRAAVPERAVVLAEVFLTRLRQAEMPRTDGGTATAQATLNHLLSITCLFPNAHLAFLDALLTPTGLGTLAQAKLVIRPASLLPRPGLRLDANMNILQEEDSAWDQAMDQHLKLLTELPEGKRVFRLDATSVQQVAKIIADSQTMPRQRQQALLLSEQLLPMLMGQHKPDLVQELRTQMQRPQLDKAIDEVDVPALEAVLGGTPEIVAAREWPELLSKCVMKAVRLGVAALSDTSRLPIDRRLAALERAAAFVRSAVQASAGQVDDATLSNLHRRAIRDWHEILDYHSFVQQAGALAPAARSTPEGQELSERVSWIFSNPLLDMIDRSLRPTSMKHTTLLHAGRVLAQLSGLAPPDPTEKPTKSPRR